MPLSDNCFPVPVGGVVRMACHSKHRVRDIRSCHGLQPHQTAHSLPVRPISPRLALLSWTYFNTRSRGDVRYRVNTKMTQHAFNEAFCAISNVPNSQSGVEAQPVYQVSSPRLLVGNFVDNAAWKSACLVRSCNPSKKKGRRAGETTAVDQPLLQAYRPARGRRAVRSCVSLSLIHI